MARSRNFAIRLPRPSPCVATGIASNRSIRTVANPGPTKINTINQRLTRLIQTSDSSNKIHDERRHFLIFLTADSSANDEEVRRVVEFTERYVGGHGFTLLSKPQILECRTGALAVYFTVGGVDEMLFYPFLYGLNNFQPESVEVSVHFYTAMQKKWLLDNMGADDYGGSGRTGLSLVRSGLVPLAPSPPANRSSMHRYIIICRVGTTEEEMAKRSMNDELKHMDGRLWIPGGSQFNIHPSPAIAVEIGDDARETSVKIMQMEGVKSIVNAQTLNELQMYLAKPFWHAHYVWMEAFGRDD